MVLGMAMSYGEQFMQNTGFTYFTIMVLVFLRKNIKPLC